MALYAQHRAGAACNTNNTTCNTFFFLGAKRQKNRSRKNSFAEILPGRSDFGQTQKKKTLDKFENFVGLVMAFSGVLEKNVVLDTECTMTYRIKNTLVWILFPGTLYLVMVKRSRIE
jgi:hypothetical protein